MCRVLPSREHPFYITSRVNGLVMIGSVPNGESYQTYGSQTRWVPLMP